MFYKQLIHEVKSSHAKVKAKKDVDLSFKPILPMVIL